MSKGPQQTPGAGKWGVRVLNLGAVWLLIDARRVGEKPHNFFHLQQMNPRKVPAADDKTVKLCHSRFQRIAH